MRASHGRHSLAEGDSAKTFDTGLRTGA